MASASWSSTMLTLLTAGLLLAPRLSTAVATPPPPSDLTLAGSPRSLPAPRAPCPPDSSGKTNAATGWETWLAILTLLTNPQMWRARLPSLLPLSWSALTVLAHGLTLPLMRFHPPGRTAFPPLAGPSRPSPPSRTRRALRDAAAFPRSIGTTEVASCTSCSMMTGSLLRQRPNHCSTPMRRSLFRPLPAWRLVSSPWRQSWSR
mmetsp:Transcript_72612/g.212825  ORF Transcript_72612/g.212825 Transcript_72612/m.212825 type:complete len:204 (-) Transcript_72612:741-1352(-)